MHATHRLHVVRENLWLRINHNLQRSFIATEITNQHFHRHVGTRFVRATDCLSPDRSTTIRKFIAIHTRDHHMAQRHESQALRDTPRFIVINGGWATCLDVAEATRASARVTKDHDRRGATTPALTHVWARGFLANRMQFVVVNNLLDALKTLATRDSRTQPIWLAANAHLRRSLLIVQHQASEINK